jgi:chemotaxis protein MotA
MKSTLIGLVSALVITFVSVFFTTDNYIIYINLMSIVIVLGGTFSASIITFGIKDLVNILNIVRKVFYKDMENPKLVIEELIDVSIQLQKNPKSIRSLVESKKIHPFIADGLKLIENDFEKDQIKQILTSSLIERKNYHMHQVEILKTLAKYPPAFGMIGTVIGLVTVLQGLGMKTGVETIGPNMAVALITTLYGLFFANYGFIPMGDNLLHRLDNDTRIRKTVIKGILLIHEKEDPIFIQEMLNAHLLPGNRIQLKGATI